MALNETLNCPSCNFSTGEFFSECPQCGVIVGKYHEAQRKKSQKLEAERLKSQQQQVFNEKVESTVQGAATGVGIGIAVGIAIFSVGFFVLMFIPFIGWVVGPIFMLGGLVAPFMCGALGMKDGINKAGSTALHGKCPYCAGQINVTVLATQKGQVLGVDCPICKKRFVVKGQSFCAV
jgi:hypothetical protein